MIDLDGFHYGSDRIRLKQPWSEVDKTHQNAIQVLRHALRTDDAELYREMERLEERCRLEKARRARNRDGPEPITIHRLLEP